MTDPLDSVGGDSHAWLRKRLDLAVDELIRQQVFESPWIEVKPAWAAPGHYLIGKARESGNDRFFFWFICGESGLLEHLAGDTAATAREAARHFSLKWQLDATRISGPESSALVERAELLYALVDDGRFWPT